MVRVVTLNHLRKRLFGLQLCPLCMKVADYSHYSSAAHLERETEHVLLDTWLGLTASPRTLTPTFYKGALLNEKKILTKEIFDAKWGSNVSHLLDVATRRWQESGGVKYKKQLIRWSPSAQMMLGCINYEGTGKYDSRNVVVPYDMLPSSGGGGGSGSGSSRDVALPGAGSSTDLVLPDGWHIHEFPENGSWWPVTAIWVPGEVDGPSIEHWRRTSCGGWVCIIVCVYQWQWAQPTAWQATVARYSRL